MNISRPHVSPRAAAAPLTSLSPTANSTSTITAYSEEQLEVLATPRTRLNDLPGDYSTDAIIDHVLRLRDAGAAGLEIPAVCMAGYQKTTLQNDAQLLQLVSFLLQELQGRLVVSINLHLPLMKEMLLTCPPG